MSISPGFSGSAKLSERLNAAKTRELASLVLKSELPHPSKDLIAPLLELLVGGPFDLKENFQIREPGVVLLLLELLPNLLEELQLELWSTLGVILHCSLGNIHACRQLHLIERCLDHLHRTKSDRVANQVARVIEILGSYSLSVRELKAVVSYLYAGQDKSWAPHSKSLIGALNNMSISVQPDVFFNFSGSAGATLTLPPLSKWPTQSGFTIATWIRIEMPYDSQRDYYKPVVYWFRTGKGLGYSAHLVGNKLVLETVGRGHKKPQTHPVDFVFQSYQWYMLSVVYMHHHIKSSELCCYLNGRAVLSADVTLPSTDDVYDKCFLGSSPASTEDAVFQGQISAVYLFKEPLSRERVAALHRLGPTYKSQFKFDAESDVPLTAQEKKLLFDGHLSSTVLFSYNAKAVDGQLCLEASPLENPSYFAHSPHATLLEGVEPVVTTLFHSTLHSLGGMQALFPMFSQLDFPQAISATAVDYNLSVKLLSLVFEMARNSTSFMLQLVQLKAMELISYLLEKVSPKHLSGELLLCIFDFSRYLFTVPNGTELLYQLIEQLILNAGLWTRAATQVQTSLYSQLATEFITKPLGITGVYLRELVGVAQLLFILREYYSLTGDAESVQKHAEVRPYLLLIIKQFVTKGKAIDPVELQCILDYLCTVPEEENLHDVMELLLALVFEDPHHIVVKMLEDLDGLKVASKLLACSSEVLTLNALKLIGKVLHHSTSKHRRTLIESIGLFTVIREKLLSAGEPVSIAMFNTLFEVLVDISTRRILDSHFLALDLSHQIEFPGMLAVMVEVLCTLHTTHSNWEESDMLMRMQLLSYISSLCIQNSKNCKAILQLCHWQHWLLMLADQQGATESDHESLQEMLYRLLHTILVYCFQEEQDGWRVWVETAAAMHAYTVTKTDANAEGLTPSQLVTVSASSFIDSSLAVSSSLEEERAENDNKELLSQTVDSVPDLAKTAVKLTKAAEKHDDSSEASSDVGLEEEAVDGQRNLQDASGDSITTSHVDSPHSSQEHLKEFSVVVSERNLEDSPPLARPVAELRATGRHKFARPSPLTSVTPPSLSRSSSGDPPKSPFMIPKNPFLTLVGKMPKFQWSASHIRLLEDLLRSLQKIVNKWKSSQLQTRRGSLEKFVGDESNKFFRSNTIHLLALTVDSIIALNGGLKHLLAKSTRSGLAESPKLQPTDSIKSSQSASLRSMDPMRVEVLLRMALDLVDVMVLSGLLKTSLVEARMKMETGGLLRQALRIVLTVASLACIKANAEYMELHEHYYQEKQVAKQLHEDSVSLLSSLGIPGCGLEKYFDLCLEKRFEYLQSCQCLLSEEYLTHLQNIIPKEGESKLVIQQLVLAVIYYLSVMCVAKYQSVLQTSGSENASESTTSLGSSESGGVETHLQKTADIESSLQGTSGADRGLSFIPGVGQSILPSSLLPSTHSTLDISEQISAAMQRVVPFLCQLLLDHKAILVKVLVGTDGRPLLTDVAVQLAENKAVVEMAMLLCSQEWQTCLKKNAGKIFSEVLSEGRNVAHFSESYLRSVSSKTTSDFEQSVNTQTQKFTEFEEQLSLYISETIRVSTDDKQLRKADERRHTMSAKELWRKVSLLVDERGSFDFTPLRHCPFWKLDLREDALRQRVQLLSNYSSGTCHEDASRRTDTEAAEVAEQGNEMTQVVAPNVSDMAGAEEVSLGSDELSESLTATEFTTEQDQASQLLSLKCQIVVLGRTIPGTLVFTSSLLTFTVDDSSEEYSKEAYLGDYCSINGKWLLQDVRAVFSRRYLHQNKALEIFFADRLSAFFVFESFKEVKLVVRRLPKVGAGTNYDLPVSRSISLASPQQLFKKSSMTAKWERREISNFDYLMYLNTVAGRSYNDLNQYPVFPWILADYTSKTLDLKDPKVYRDFSKPIGALNPARLSHLQERFDSWEEDRVPPFFYGTHYSTMAFVLHWLVRVEPFSNLHIKFHDGYFDFGARMFSSLSESWKNTWESTADVKELIPEFFYLPEMLLNENKFDLGHEGACEEGDVINDVTLPPWGSSAHDFIRIHREALESEYVSANLHHWIDLIFGYKQRGEEAVKAKNVFYYLTYTGAVDLDSISDPKLRKGLEDQIRHFGQTPAQLLKEPHPSRQLLVKEFPPQPIQGINPRDPAVVAELQIMPDVPIALVQLSRPPSSSVLAITYNQLYTINGWSVNSGTSSQPPTVSLEPDPQISIGLKARLGDPLDQSLSASAACFAAIPENEVVMVCGFWDNSFKCFATKSGMMLQSIFAHRDIVTCITFSPEVGLFGTPGDGLIASGSHDATVLLWRWSGRENKVVGLLNERQVDSVTPVAVLTGHEQSVVCVAVSFNLGLVISGAKYGCFLVHTTSGELLHKLIPSTQLVYPHMASITRNGHVVVHYADRSGCLAVFTCNGKQLCQHSLGDPALALCVSRDGQYVVTGGFDCKIKVFSEHNLQLKYTHEPLGSSIRSLYLSEDERFVFAGLASGSIAVLTTHFWLQ